MDLIIATIKFGLLIEVLRFFFRISSDMNAKKLMAYTDSVSNGEAWSGASKLGRCLEFVKYKLEKIKFWEYKYKPSAVDHKALAKIEDGQDREIMEFMYRCFCLGCEVVIRDKRDKKEDSTCGH